MQDILVGLKVEGKETYISGPYNRWTMNIMIEFNAHTQKKKNKME